MKGTSLAKRIVPSPNVEPRRDGCQPDIILLHYTGMESAEKACDWLCSPASRVSCHYLIDETGGITQMVDEELRAWHAGVSTWEKDIDVNSRSIGIEIQNPGHSAGYPGFKHLQMKSVIALCQDIAERYDIMPKRVLAHSDVAPSRKIDPGEKFNWKLLSQEGLGLWVPPARISKGSVLILGDQGRAVEDLQRKLLSYGYGSPCSGVFDRETELVVTAFQRHFRQRRVDGKADRSTLETLDRLLKASKS